MPVHRRRTSPIIISFSLVADQLFIGLAARVTFHFVATIASRELFHESSNRIEKSIARVVGEVVTVSEQLTLLVVS